MAAAAPSITSLQVIPKQKRRGVASSCMSPTFITEQKYNPRISQMPVSGDSDNNKTWRGLFLRKEYVIMKIKLAIGTQKRRMRVRSPDA